MLKLSLRILLSAFMIFAGMTHFKNPGVYEKIVPPYLPFPRKLVFISGFFEVIGGVGLLIPQFTHAAAWGLVALFICVFPANIHMAINNVPFGDSLTSPLARWIRLPLQGVLIAWAWWLTK